MSYLVGGKGKPGQYGGKILEKKGNRLVYIYNVHISEIDLRPLDQNFDEERSLKEVKEDIICKLSKRDLDSDIDGYKIIVKVKSAEENSIELQRTDDVTCIKVVSDTSLKEDSRKMFESVEEVLKKQSEFEEQYGRYFNQRARPFS